MPPSDTGPALAINRLDWGIIGVVTAMESPEVLGTDVLDGWD